MMTPVVDAFGGTSVESHQAGIERIAQADARPITWVALIFNCGEIGTAKNGPRLREDSVLSRMITVRQ